MRVFGSGQDHTGSNAGDLGPPIQGRTTAESGSQRPPFGNGSPVAEAGAFLTAETGQIPETDAPSMLVTYLVIPQSWDTRQEDVFLGVGCLPCLLVLVTLFHCKVNPMGASEVDPGCIDFKPGDRPISPIGLQQLHPGTLSWGQPIHR